MVRLRCPASHTNIGLTRCELRRISHCVAVSPADQAIGGGGSAYHTKQIRFQDTKGLARNKLRSVRGRWYQRLANQIIDWKGVTYRSFFFLQFRILQATPSVYGVQPSAIQSTRLPYRATAGRALCNSSLQYPERRLLCGRSTIIPSVLAPFSVSESLSKRPRVPLGLAAMPCHIQHRPVIRETFWCG